jgi:hypothetical protein
LREQLRYGDGVTVLRKGPHCTQCQQRIEPSEIAPIEIFTAILATSAPKGCGDISVRGNVSPTGLMSRPGARHPENALVAGVMPWM